MSDLHLAPERLTCTERHLPGCYNTWQDRTWCLCGATTWAGDVGVWINHDVRTVAPMPEHAGRGMGLGAVGLADQSVHLGWRIYFLHATGCPDRDETHDLCRPRVSADPVQPVQAETPEKPWTEPDLFEAAS